MANSYRYFTTATICFSIIAENDDEADKVAQAYLADLDEAFDLIDDEHEVRCYPDPSENGLYPLEFAGMEEEDVEECGDDLCDQCMRSGVEVARTNDAGETICIDCDESCE